MFSVHLRANTPYAQFGDTNYEINRVGSTINLTVGPSYGRQGSMSDFWDGVTTLTLSRPVCDRGYLVKPADSLHFRYCQNTPLTSNLPTLDLLRPRRLAPIQPECLSHL